MYVWKKYIKLRIRVYNNIYRINEINEILYYENNGYNIKTRLCGNSIAFTARNFERPVYRIVYMVAIIQRWDRIFIEECYSTGVRLVLKEAYLVGSVKVLTREVNVLREKRRSCMSVWCGQTNRITRQLFFFPRLNVHLQPEGCEHKRIWQNNI